MTTYPSLVSILIPLFNSEKYIRKALQSVVSQSYSNIEVIIVDDCSTDSSLTVAKEFFIEHNTIPHVIIKNDKNEGVSITRNKLVDNANGDFICFLDSDDYFDHDAIDYLIRIVTSNNTSIGQCLYYSETPDGHPVGTTNKFSPNVILQGKDAVFSMLENEITGFLWHKIFRREVFQDVSFDSKLPVFEDYLVIMTMFIKGANISFGNEQKYHYIQHTSSLTKKSYQKSLDRLLYLDMTKTLVQPLISTEVDKLRLIKHEYMVILMVFINAVKFGAPASDVAKIKEYINIHSLIKLKKQLNLKRFYAIFMIKISPYLFYFMLKTAFKIKS